MRLIDLETLAKLAILNPKANCNRAIHCFFIVSLIICIITIFLILSPTTMTLEVSEKEDETLLSLLSSDLYCLGLHFVF